MIDPTTESLVSLTEAARLLPARRGGKRPHVSSLYRWTKAGRRGVVLESIQVGGTRCTSKEALARFFEALTHAPVLRQLADSSQRQDRLEIQQKEAARKLEYVAGKVRDMDGDTGYITVLGYGRLKHISLPISEARRHGKALSEIHRQRRIRIGWVPDERHGRVNAYRIDVVEEYFARVSGRA